MQIMNNQTSAEIDIKRIQIAGFKSDLTNFKEVMEELKLNYPSCVIQLMDADAVAGVQHVLNSTIHAIKSFSRNENIASDIGLEICVRTSGQRQISQAIKMLGIRNGKMNVCAVALDCKSNIMEDLINILGLRDDHVLEPDTDKLRSIYKISDTQLETNPDISKILMEKTALLIIDT
ncbi:MAG: KEOPS complex subunit Cgi121 [Methanobacterium sp. ERen5]|nr:MAG: KEOPS complex subunit Cgi121 [Methanobacterium sp. ERen5]